MKEVVNKLEDSLNGCFSGLYGEVVTEDSYRLHQLDFTPNIIIDAGSNIGIFTRFAHELFPQAFIIAVEPNPDNCAVFRKFTKPDENICLLEMAIGRGRTYRKTDATNGSNEEYLSLSDHIKQEDIEGSGRAEISEVELVMFDELVNDWFFPDDRMLIKIDIEGNENTIWEHKESLEALSLADYIVIEIHPTAFTGIEQEKAKQNLLNAIEFLKHTHEVEYEHIYLYAKKKK